MAHGTTLPPAPVPERTQQLFAARVRLKGDLGAARAAAEQARWEYEEAEMRCYLKELPKEAAAAAGARLKAAEEGADRLEAAMRALRSRLGPY